MCIGIPMQIISSQGLSAQCDSLGKLHQIDLSLIGEQEDGTWVLTFLDTAREVLSESQAKQIKDALQALSMTINGETPDVDMLFADLVQKEPELPPHLR